MDKPWERFSAKPWDRFAPRSVALPEEEPVPDAFSVENSPELRMGGIGAALEPRTSSVSRREARTGSPASARQSLGDIGRRVARGATEIVASVPEAVAIAGAGNPNASALFAQEEVTKAQTQIAEAQARLRDNQSMSDENKARIADVIAQQERVIDAYQPLVDQAEGPLRPEAQDRVLFQRGDRVRQAALELFGAPDPQFDDRFVSKLAEGGGSMAGFVATTLLTGPLGGAVTGSALNTSNMYRRALAEGATEEQARTSAYIGAMVGVSEVVPIGRALRMLPKGSSERVSKALGRRLTNAFSTGGEESVQEALTEISNNLTAKGVYNPEQDWAEGALESALIGGILGGGLGAVVPTGRAEPELTESDIAAPTSNEFIREGKAEIERMLEEAGNPSAKQDIQTSAPTPPSTGVPPLPKTGSNARTPETDGFRSPIAEMSPMPPFRPGLPNAPSEPAEQPGFEILEEVETPQGGGEAMPTGRQVRLNVKTGAVEIYTPQQETDAQTSEAPEPQIEEPVSGQISLEDSVAAQVAPPSDEVQVLRNEDLTSVEADPETFQYKTGGDTEGVTDRLQGVQKWETERAGTAIVYEYEDGRRIIADGHQRLGLAKRLRAEGQNVELPVIIRREADGYTPEQVMVRAALKNIAESPNLSNADPQLTIDAAKVMRADQDMTAEEMNLPPKSALVRHASSLRKLSDDAFGMLLNNPDTMRNASVVGTVVEDQSLHSNILSILNSAKGIANEFQAEVVARQAAADTAVATQDSLFGEEQLNESLYVERARVMDGAIKRLKKDKSTFNTLIERGTTISQEGNSLDQVANRRRLEDDAVIQEYITRQANTKGEISDALSEAARRLKAGENAGQVVTSFVQTVRAGVAGGSQGREVSNADRQRVQQANERSESRAETVPVDNSYVVREKSSGNVLFETSDRKKVDALNTEKYEAVPISQYLPELNQRIKAEDAVSEPTDAGEQIIIPGVEPISTDDRQRAEIAARAEAPLTGENTASAGRGDLFGDPSERTDLFDTPANSSDAPRLQSVRKEQRQEDTFSTDFLSQVGAVEDAYAYPTSSGTTLDSVFSDIDPTIRVLGETQTPEETSEAGADERFLLRTHGGKQGGSDFYVYQNADEVWVDVSRLAEGEGGSAIYAAVSDYAANTGKVFIGDPAGLSDIAVVRRTENMLSSALKHGSTDHLRPHARQLAGFESNPALKWTEGDYLGNVRSMIEVSTANLFSSVPELRDARYDFQTRTFRNSEGQLLSDETLREISNTSGGARAAGGGHRTLKRGIFLNTLLRQESSSQPGLLERTLRQPDKLVTGTPLEGIFYQTATATPTEGSVGSIGEPPRGPLGDQRGERGSPESDAREGFDRLEALQSALPALQERLKRVGLARVSLDVEPNATWQGVFESVGGDLRILIGNASDPNKTLSHEVVHALRNLNLFSEKEWSALSRAAGQWKRQYNIDQRYADLTEEARTEEAIAEAFADFAFDSAPRGTVSNAFAKVRRFLKAVREWIGARPSVRDIFEDIESGAIGTRDQGGDTASRKEQRQIPLDEGMASPFVPDQRTFDALHARNAGIMERLRATRDGVSGDFDRFRTVIQDRMLPIMRMEQAVAAVRGTPIDKDESTYYAEERFFGRTGRQLDSLDERFTRPVIDMIAKQNRVKKPVTLTDHKGETRKGEEAVSLWLWARHAQERNARIASINEDLPDGGSGLTNSQAAEILEQGSKGKHAKLLARVGEMVDQLTADLIDTREQMGLLSAQEAATWRNMYQHYVPLKGFADTDLAEASLDFMGTGRRYNIKGAESRTALGRTTEAFDPLATLVSQAQQTIIRAEKNLVGQTMLKFAQGNPAPEMYEISVPEQRRYFNKTTGMVESRTVSPLTRQQLENELAVKVDGKEYRLTFKDQRLARAMSGVGADQMGLGMRIASGFARWFSAVNTMLSPSFVVVNAARDMMTAQVNLGGFGGKDAGRIRRRVITGWPKAFMGGMRAMRGEESTQWAQYFREYEEAGGKVAFWKMEQPEAGRSDLSKRVRLDSSWIGKASKFALPSTRDNPLLEWVERVNLAVDNAVRLSAFVEAREAGWTPSEAASLSKNLTVNFNRRGEIGAAMNALYPFFNAAVQGTQVLLKAMSHKQVQRAVSGMVVFGLLNDLLNAARSEEDEDGELAYDKIPVYMSERNLVFMTGGENEVTIPLPYGFNTFFFAGQQLGKTLRGVKDPGEASAQVLGATFRAFSPLSGDTVYDTALPTALDFANELAQNKDWLGRNIRPENPYGDYGPDAYKHYGSVSNISKGLAYTLNDLTGGSSTRSGWIDISPEYIDHTFAFLMGGAGRFAGKVVDLGQKVVNDQEIESRDFPIARKLVYSTNEFLDRNRFWEFAESVREANDARKTALETKDTLTESQLKQASLYQEFLAANRARRKISDRKNAIYADKSLTPRMREQKLKPLYAEEHRVYLQFNRMYLRKMGPQAE